MKPAFGGKTIRCRGCKVTFRVRATEGTLDAPSRPEGTLVADRRQAALQPPVRPLKPPPLPRPPAPGPVRPATVFEDMGDVLDELLPGEEVASVVRPRSRGRRVVPVDGPVSTVIAVVLGGACAIPVALVLLRFISPAQFDRVAAGLPRFLSDWLR
jgi:hypothetical protein